MYKDSALIVFGYLTAALALLHDMRAILAILFESYHPAPQWRLVKNRKRGAENLSNLAGRRKNLVA